MMPSVAPFCDFEANVFLSAQNSCVRSVSDCAARPTAGGRAGCDARSDEYRAVPIRNFFDTFSTTMACGRSYG